MLLLGIETSCDDTATAIVRDGRDVVASVSTNQDEFHAKYGGIVPEIASRQHVALLSAAIEDALARSNTAFADLDGIAVTYGPGLIGSLVVAWRLEKHSPSRSISPFTQSITYTATSSQRSSIAPSRRRFRS